MKGNGICLNPSHKGKGDSKDSITTSKTPTSLNPSHKGKGDSPITTMVLAPLQS